ncbi:MAG: right-handed parallel beta-helix repeat-containing protein [Limnothrix sp.]
MIQRSLAFSICALVAGNLSVPAAIAQTLQLENFAHLPAQPTAIAQAVETPTQTFFVKPKYGINFTTGPGSGYDSSFGSVYGWLPFAQNGTSQLFYTEAKANVNSDNGNWGGNLAVGYRNFTAETIFGGYFGYDVQGLEGWTAHQLGAGLEAMNPKWEARLNGYLPVGDRRQIIDSSTAGSFTDTNMTQNVVTDTAFKGNNLFLSAQTTTKTTTTQTNIQQTISEESLAGLDFEVGTKLADWKNGNLKGFLGSYLYSGDRTGTFVGIRSRLQADLANLNFGVVFESDGEFGTNLIFSFGTDFGGQTRAATNDQLEAIGSPLARQTNIATKRYSDRQATTTETVTEAVTTADEIVLNPDSNQPLFFSHVKLGSAATGAGTEESPYGAIASAISSVPTDGNGIIYVAGTGTQPGFQIPAQVKVLSSAPVQTLSVKTATSAAQDLVLPRSGTGLGDRPQLTSTVTFSDGGGELNGFEFNTGGSVLFENVGGEVVITNNLISNSNGDAIAGNLGSGATTTIRIFKNQIENPTLLAAPPTVPSADGIDIEVTGNSTVTLLIDDNNITNAQNSGIELETNPDSASPNSILNSTITNNRITNSGGDGILFLHNSDVNMQMTASGNVIDGAGVSANGITRTKGSVTVPNPLAAVPGQPATVNADIDINIGAGGFGIGVITLADGDLDLTFSDNTISNTQDAKIGIAANPSFLYTADTVDTGNPLFNGAAAVQLQGTFAGSSRINANIFGNTLAGSGAGIADLTGAGLSNYNTGSFTAIAGSASKVCINTLTNNNTENSGTPANGYQYVQNGATSTIFLGTNSGNTGSSVTTEGTLALSCP